MRHWHDDPGALAWRQSAEAADRHRGTVMPPEQLPGLIAGRAEVALAWQLLAGPLTPVDLTPGRMALRRALKILPQSGPDPNCYEQRWRDRGWSGGQPLELCKRPTCGRCVPLRLTGHR
ncbi:hypothetical protein GCM10012285_61650 [Streptomyces kronopolitis]|uniref:Uncharacterized protein n=1 Tax=Streptomyces kronopolitis TaxID=1612435 RepID=A0ABQ2K1Z6_9ACTN|nr:hypothetical protein GCM10012285_61650 [Streptomyces kronopolitis]